MRLDLSFFIILARILAPMLAQSGKSWQAQLLNEAVLAVSAGKNVDDIMHKLAQKWQELGEPSWDEIEAARRAIQARMAEADKEPVPVPVVATPPVEDENEGGAITLSSKAPKAKK